MPEFTKDGERDDSNQVDTFAGRTCGALDLRDARCRGEDVVAPAGLVRGVGAARLGDPKLRVLDARSKADYDKGHIPGAVWVDAKAVAALAVKNPGVLTDRKAWESRLAPLGIAPNTEVYLYDANRQLDAARLWWLLGYLGVERAGLVNGGFPLWAAENRPVTTEVPTVALSSFKVAFRNHWNATRAEVLAAIQAKSARIVDAGAGGRMRAGKAGEAWGAYSGSVPPRMVGPC